MTHLTRRLEGRTLFAEKITLTLHCEYSEEKHSIEVQLTPACRKLSLFMDLIEQKLADVSLENPIQQMEIDLQVQDSHHQLNN